MTPEGASFVKMAHLAVEASRTLHTADEYPGFVISRAYYAMFYAATAVLHNNGKSYSSHAAVISAFGKDIVHAGHVPQELQRHFIHAS